MHQPFDNYFEYIGYSEKPKQNLFNFLTWFL
jgi:hypothetical protein